MKKMLAALFLFVSALLSSAQLDCNQGIATAYDFTGGPCDNFGTLLDERSDLFVSGMAVNIPPDNITYVRKRELTLSCNDDQACKSLGGNVVCFDEKTGDFIVLDGTKGNIKTGHYTTKKGQTGNIFCDRRATPLPSSAYDLVGATSLVHAPKAATLISPDIGLLTQYTGSASSLKNAVSSATSAASTGNRVSASSASSDMLVDHSLYNIVFAGLLMAGMIIGSFLWLTFQL